MDGSNELLTGLDILLLCSSVRSLVTHLAVFFSRPKSWFRMAWMVETDLHGQ
jgi:hypothetical protein